MSRWRDLLCGEVRPEHVGRRLTLSGWAATRRDHGGLIFVDLRDRSGRCQLVVNPERAPAAAEVAHTIRNEYVLRAVGELAARAPDAVNPKLPTGAPMPSTSAARTTSPSASTSTRRRIFHSWSATAAGSRTSS